MKKILLYLVRFFMLYGVFIDLIVFPGLVLFKVPNFPIPNWLGWITIICSVIMAFPTGAVLFALALWLLISFVIFIETLIDFAISGEWKYDKFDDAFEFPKAVLRMILK